MVGKSFPQSLCKLSAKSEGMEFISTLASARIKQKLEINKLSLTIIGLVLPTMTTPTMPGT